ncbi:MAG: PEGA domain-containing protein [Luteitalea sp.]|nr:PEGA domain-containing protein [Luteitalea sp.]
MDARLSDGGGSNSHVHRGSMAFIPDGPPKASGDRRSPDGASPGHRPSTGTPGAAPDFGAVDVELRQSPLEIPDMPAWAQTKRESPASQDAGHGPDFDTPVRRQTTADDPAPAEFPAPAPFLDRIASAPRSRRAVLALVCIAAALALGVPGWRYLRQVRAGVGSTAASMPGGGATGVATFQSKPSGVEVAIRGALQGTTPLKLTLPVGEHVVEIGNGPDKRPLTVVIAADTVASYYVEGVTLDAASGGAVGRLEIVSDPPGAQVSVDGVRRGVAPLDLTGIAVGEHRISLSRDGTTINKTVRVTAGATATVMAATGPAGGAAGWVSIAAPFEMKIFEGSTLLGTTSSTRIMLPAGAHTFELVNEDLAFTTKLPVRVIPGGTVTANVSIPNGLLSVNAQPWADVLIDGVAVGTTPLGNLAVPIGAREVVLRHPQFGERRRTVNVTANAPARIGVDFNQ